MISIADLFVRDRTVARMRGGSLGQHLDGFVVELAALGYCRESIRCKVRVAASFSWWLDLRGVAANDVGAVECDRFVAQRRRKRVLAAGDRTTVTQIARFIGCDSPNHLPTSPIDLSPVERVLSDFQRWMDQSRGLSPITIRLYLPWATTFLCEQAIHDVGEFEKLRGADIFSFVQGHARDHSYSRAQLVLKALRTFFRFLLHHGMISIDLANFVPSVAGWATTTLRKPLHSDQVNKVLSNTDQTTAIGRRDYAMLLLFARLGLRAGEVSNLTLEDIDWGTGSFRVRNKGGMWTSLPMPQDAGDAIVRYLTLGRPESTDRRVFLRGKAPFSGFASSSGVAGIASRALRRAGVEGTRGGAHVFRHSLASTMLCNGASLAEIGRVLRHQHPDSTRRYAKIDLEGLRKLALPWPRAPA